MRKKTKRKVKVRPINRHCVYCKEKKEPSYKDVETVNDFVTERARMVGRARSGVCSKHQRRLATAIKRSRHLGLLPFSGGI